jgi:hypothetical protein
MKKNWKTSLVGAVVILAGVALSATGNVYGAALIPVGLGFLFTKDSDVTGGSTPATPEAEKRVEK